jgi:hypothetical protein
LESVVEVLLRRDIIPSISKPFWWNWISPCSSGQIRPLLFVEILQGALYPFLYFRVFGRHYGMNCGRCKIKEKKIVKFGVGMTIFVGSVGTRN